jgi:protein tyrosine/serine phosphatase
MKTLRINHVALRLALVGVLAGAGACAHLDDNLQTIETGQAYRAGQMDDARLAATLRRHDIRTVVNLRGASDDSWHTEEKAVCAAFGVAHHDLEWTMKRLPPPESLAAYIRIVEQAERPILIHCQGGTHRSGVAAAVFELLRDATVDEARDQFGFFFNNAPIGELLTLYEGSDKPFADWVRQDYPALHAQRQ